MKSPILIITRHRGVKNMTEQKKVSLQEMMKQQLAAKQNKNAQAKGSLKGDVSTKKLTSQQTKKASNTRRKMGV